MRGIKEYTTVEGRQIKVDVSKKTLDPLGFFHGERLMSTYGVRVTVIGVAEKRIWIQYDDRKGIQSCINAISKSDLLNAKFRPLRGVKRGGKNA